MSLIWKECSGLKHITTISTAAWRIVEDQAKSSTRKIVANSLEHEILEAILEDSKPKIASDLHGLHYLLFTPFRYPPLKHGSRFGPRNERSIFYAALELETAMAEIAFYRMAFIRASHAKLGNKSFTLTSFKLKVHTCKGIDLTIKPFTNYKAQISAPDSYAHSQALGSALRKDGIEAFISYSAKSKLAGKNINVLAPQAIRNSQDLAATFQHWTCFATRDNFEFTPKFVAQPTTVVFHATEFMVDGMFPNIP